MFSHLKGEVVVDPPVLALGDQVLDVATNDLTKKSIRIRINKLAFRKSFSHLSVQLLVVNDGWVPNRLVAKLLLPHVTAFNTLYFIFFVFFLIFHFVSHGVWCWYPSPRIFLSTLYRSLPVIIRHCRKKNSKFN